MRNYGKRSWLTKWFNEIGKIKKLAGIWPASFDIKKKEVILWRTYFPPRFEALRGLTFLPWPLSVLSVTICVPILHDPIFHLLSGSGLTEQNLPVGYSEILAHPSHLSITERHEPSL